MGATDENRVALFDLAHLLRAAEDPLLRWMDQVAQQQLARRENTIAEIRTTADARTSQAIGPRQTSGDPRWPLGLPWTVERPHHRPPHQWVLHPGEARPRRSRIGKLWLDHTPYSLSAAMDGANRPPRSGIPVSLLGPDRRSVPRGASPLNGLEAVEWLRGADLRRAARPKLRRSPPGGGRVLHGKRQAPRHSG